MYSRYKSLIKKMICRYCLLFRKLSFHFPDSVCWRFMSPQNPYIETLKPIVVVLGYRTFGRCSGHKSETLMCGIMLLQKSPQSSRVFSDVWGHKEESVSRKRALTWPHWDLDLRLLSSTTVRNEILLCKLRSLWYFLIAAQTDKDSVLWSTKIFNLAKSNLSVCCCCSCFWCHI